MHENHPTPDDEHPGQRPAPVAPAMASPPHEPAAQLQERRLEKTVGWSRSERLRFLWYRLRLTIAEMNYATRRMVELQAPWISDDRRR